MKHFKIIESYFAHLLWTDFPPVVACIDDVTETIPLGNGGTTVFWTEPTATDDSGIVTLQERSNVPGSFFQTGTTTVTYTFVDSGGNTADCVFRVIITEGWLVA